MRILITPDVPDWAIGALTRAIVRYADSRHQFTVVNVHPRAWQGPALQIREYIKEHGPFDLWHCMYWNSGMRLLENLPELKDVPKILTHTNHNALTKEDWSAWDRVVVATDYARDVLVPRYQKKIVKIPYGIDLDRFSFFDERRDDQQTVGYVGRVVAWKHLKETVEESHAIGAHVLATGYVDDPKYFATVPKEGLDFVGGIGRGLMTPADVKDSLYERMSVFVMYSSGEYESGTLPLLEAMARGVPVMATSQGMARDIIQDGKNGILFTPATFRERLDTLLKDRKLQEQLRQNAWKTVKDYNEPAYSYAYCKLYAEVIQEHVAPGKPTVSVVIPVFNRAEALLNSLTSLATQAKGYVEAIVVDDGSTEPAVQTVMRDASKKFPLTIMPLSTGNIPATYGLARARNIGITEALGEIVLFLDVRFTLEPNALAQILAIPMKPKTFYYGTKIIDGTVSTKSAFIENFAWCRRQDLIDAGMFPEWLTMYGGMSQEIRTRLTRQGWTFTKVDAATAAESTGSPRHKKKSEVWRSKFLLRKLYG